MCACWSGAIVALSKLGVRVRKLITCEKEAASEAVVRRFVEKNAEMIQGRKDAALPLHEFYQPLGDILPKASEGRQPPISQAFVRK